MPAGKRLAPVLAELVAILRRFGELDIDDDTAALLAGMSAATIDRRLAPERRKHQLTGRSRTKPGSLLKSQIPMRTWAEWDDAVPGFVEIDLVSHDGGNAAGEHAWTQRQDRSSSLRCGRSVLIPALTQCCLPGGRKPAKPLVNNPVDKAPSLQG